MTIIDDISYVDNKIYRCKNGQCRKKEALFFDSILSVPKIQINNKLLAIYEYLARDYERRILNDCSMAKRTYQKLKKNLVDFFRFRNHEYKGIMMDGNYSVQIDETVIYKRTFIKSPSNLYDNIPGLTWLVGFIEEHTDRIYIEVVENRKSKTLANLIRKHVYVGTLIITDGYPTYPKAVHDSLCTHEFVNHSVGFKNKNGFSTNNIENVWSQLRYEEKKRKGVKSHQYKHFWKNLFSDIIILNLVTLVK